MASKRHSEQERPPGKPLTKTELIDAIGEQFRVNQNRTDVFDDIAAKVLGINRTDQRCVDIVTRLGCATAGELAREAGLTTGAVTSVIDHLERAGWVRRRHDSEDRRRVLIEPTPQVYRKAAEIWGPMKEAWDNRARRYSREQLEFLLDFMVTSNGLADEQIERIRRLASE